MSSPDRNWWNVRAGEYVLGTLDERERELFTRILRHDPDLRGDVSAWQARLAPLDASASSSAPPERVWRAIERRVQAEPHPAARMTASPSAAVGPTDLDALEESLASADGTARLEPVRTPPPPPPPRGLFVPAVAAFATAASLILGVLLHQERERLDALEASILQAEGISVILGEDGAPLWLVQADFEGERVRVTALAPPPLEGEGDYQLWQVLPDEGGVAAVSLLPEDDGESRETRVPDLARTFDAFAVSLEPTAVRRSRGRRGRCCIRGT